MPANKLKTINNKKPTFIQIPNGSYEDNLELRYSKACYIMEKIEHNMRNGRPHKYDANDRRKYQRVIEEYHRYQAKQADKRREEEQNQKVDQKNINEDLKSQESRAVNKKEVQVKKEATGENNLEALKCLGTRGDIKKENEQEDEIQQSMKEDTNCKGTRTEEEEQKEACPKQEGEECLEEYPNYEMSPQLDLLSRNEIKDEDLRTTFYSLQECPKQGTAAQLEDEDLRTTFNSLQECPKQGTAVQLKELARNELEDEERIEAHPPPSLQSEMRHETNVQSSNQHLDKVYERLLELSGLSSTQTAVIKNASTRHTEGFQLTVNCFATDEREEANDNNMHAEVAARSYIPHKGLYKRAIRFLRHVAKLKELTPSQMKFKQLSEQRVKIYEEVMGLNHESAMATESASLTETAGMSSVEAEMQQMPSQAAEARNYHKISSSATTNTSIPSSFQQKSQNSPTNLQPSNSWWHSGDAQVASYFEKSIEQKTAYSFNTQCRLYQEGPIMAAQCYGEFPATFNRNCGDHTTASSHTHLYLSDRPNTEQNLDVEVIRAKLEKRIYEFLTETEPELEVSPTRSSRTRQQWERSQSSQNLSEEYETFSKKIKLNPETHITTTTAFGNASQQQQSCLWVSTSNTSNSKQLGNTTAQQNNTEIPPPRTVVKVWIPAPLMEDSAILKIIKAQNQDLYSRDWTLINSRVRDNPDVGKDLYISISTTAWERLRLAKGELRYGIQRLKAFVTAQV